MNSGPSGSNHNKIPKYKNFRHFLIYLRTIKTIALTKIKKKIQFFLSVFFLMDSMFLLIAKNWKIYKNVLWWLGVSAPTSLKDRSSFNYNNYHDCTWILWFYLHTSLKALPENFFLFKKNWNLAIPGHPWVSTKNGSPIGPAVLPAVRNIYTNFVKKFQIAIVKSLFSIKEWMLTALSILERSPIQVLAQCYLFVATNLVLIAF